MEDFYYRKLKVYQLAKQMANEVYLLAKTFPLDEQNILANQLLRSSLSVPSNIAEGMGRTSPKEQVHFLEISYGSLMEVLCQLQLAHDLDYITVEEFYERRAQIQTTAKILSGLRSSLIKH